MDLRGILLRVGETRVREGRREGRKGGGRRKGIKGPALDQAKIDATELPTNGMILT